MALDHADLTGIHQFVRSTNRTFDHIDTLVLCATVYESGPWTSASVDTLDMLYRVNILAMTRSYRVCSRSDGNPNAEKNFGERRTRFCTESAAKGE